MFSHSFLQILSCFELKVKLFINFKTGYVHFNLFPLADAKYFDSYESRVHNEQFLLLIATLFSIIIYKFSFMEIYCIFALILSNFSAADLLCILEREGKG